MTKSSIDWRPSWILPIWRPLWAPALAPSKNVFSMSYTTSVPNFMLVDKSEQSTPHFSLSSWTITWNTAPSAMLNKKAVLSQRWPRNAPYVWVPWKFSGLPDYVHGHYSQYFYRLLLWSTLWMFLQNLKSVALPIAEIIIWAIPGYAHASFSENFLMGFYSDRLCKYTRQIWSP